MITESSHHNQDQSIRGDRESRRHREGDERASKGAEPPSCLYSNNSIGTYTSECESDKESHVQALCGVLTPYHKKQAQTLYLNVERLVKRVAKSTNHVGFLTLTFQENIIDHKEAYKRFRSFNSNFLSKHSQFGEWVCVKERQKRGAWHYHMVITLGDDIRTGFDFDEYDTWLKGPRLKGTFPTGNAYIRRLWDELRENLETYGMGRIFSLEPVRANSEAMARYVGKYISKHIDQRDDEDKGVRLVNYSRNWSKNSVKFAWNTDNAKEWRTKLRLFALSHGCHELYQLTEKLGPGWAYKFADDIYNIYANCDLVAENHNKKYSPSVLQLIKKNKKDRERRLRKNLVLHEGRSERAKRLERQKGSVRSRLPQLIEEHIKNLNEGEKQCTSMIPF